MGLPSSLTDNWNGLPLWAWIVIAVVVVVLIIAIAVVCAKISRAKKAAKSESAVGKDQDELKEEPVREEQIVKAEPVQEVEEMDEEPEEEPEEKPVVKKSEDKIVVEEKDDDEQSAEDKKKTAKVYHITKRKADGKWQVKFNNGAKAIKLFNTQAEAIEYAKVLAQRQEAGIMIHKEDGTFRRLNYKKKSGK